jgi:hypothetical protein
VKDQAQPLLGLVGVEYGIPPQSKVVDTRESCPGAEMLSCVGDELFVAEISCLAQKAQCLKGCSACMLTNPEINTLDH